MKKVLLLFLAWFLVINVFALVANNRVNLKPDTSYPWINPDHTFQTQGWDLKSIHSRWDSYWYHDIARNGYSVKGDDQLSNIVFFPLYPFLISVMAIFLGGDLILAGWLISSLFILLSSIYLYKIVKEFHSEADPVLTVLLLLIFPTAFFLTSVYTESTFLFFSLAAFYYTLKKQYLLASIFGFFAALTRITGLLLFLPLLFEYIKEHKKSFLKFTLFEFLLIPLGTFLFFFYHYLKFGDLFLFLKVEKLWGRGFNLNLDQYKALTDPGVANLSLDLFLLVSVLVATVFVFKRLRVSYGIYMLTTLLVALSSGTSMSIGRYILILFPIYILGATIKNEAYRYIWIMVSVLLLGLYTLLFVTHYWAG